MPDLKFGIADAGIQHASDKTVSCIKTKFSMVKDAEVFDYIEATPTRDMAAEYERCSQQFNIPILAGSRNYILGSQEGELEENLRIGASLGSVVHNTQIFMDHAAGYLVSNDEVMRCFLNAYEFGEKIGCIPTFETHVNMWSEKFSRVIEVADMVKARGAPFGITLDHSHVVFKVNNPIELNVFGVDKLIESGELILDTTHPNNIITQWIDAGLVNHAHARAVAPNNPKNTVAHHPDINNLRSSLHPKSTVGRGIQYPFTKPIKDEWHSEWLLDDLEPWKNAMRYLLNYHANNQQSRLQMITAEYIPFTDYGEGSTYSLINNNAACVNWLRNTWQDTLNKI